MARDSSDAGFVPALERGHPGPLVLGLLLGLLALVATAPFLPVTTQLERFTTGFFAYLPVQAALVLLWLLPPVVVESPHAGRLLDGVAARVPTTQRHIVYATAFVALLLGWVNWAAGLIGGVLLGQRLCARARSAGVPVHYPLVLTGGLLGLVLANQGPTSPGGLLMASQSGALDLPHLAVGVVPLSRFVFHPANLVPSAILVVTLPALLVWMAPERADAIEPLGAGNRVLEGSVEAAFTPDPADGDPAVVADRLERSPAITYATVLLGGVSVAAYLAAGGRVTLLWVLFGLVVLGLAVHHRPMTFTRKVERTTRWIDHLALPFVFYAGVVSLLAAAGAYPWLGTRLVDGTGPFLGAYVGSLALGLAVTDPGSLWILLAPAMASASDPLLTLIAVMYGAGLSNFWLGFLFAGILSLRGFAVRKLAGYTLVITGYVSAVLLGSAVLLA